MRGSTPTFEGCFGRDSEDVAPDRMVCAGACVLWWCVAPLSAYMDGRQTHWAFLALAQPWIAILPDSADLAISGICADFLHWHPACASMARLGLDTDPLQRHGLVATQRVAQTAASRVVEPSDGGCGSAFEVPLLPTRFTKDFRTMVALERCTAEHQA